MKPEDRAAVKAAGDAWEAAKDRYEAAKAGGAPITDLLRAKAAVVSTRTAFLAALRAKGLLLTKAARR